jgi:hypothetical protein
LPKSLNYKLYELAKSYLIAANILTKNSLYPQAIYFYAQAFEKAAKSAVALYLTSYENESKSQVSGKLKNVHSHRLLSLTSKTAEIFVDSGIRSHVKRGGKENDKEVQAAKYASSIPYLETLKPDKKKLIEHYEHNVKAVYEQLYTKLKEDYTKLMEEPFLGSENARREKGLELLRELCKIPRAKYIKFNILARILFPILDGMDSYARYPMNDIGNNNVAFLNRPEIRGACLLLGEMVEELVSLVPLVWNKIESLKPS